MSNVIEWEEAFELLRNLGHDPENFKEFGIFGNVITWKAAEQDFASFSDMTYGAPLTRHTMWVEKYPDGTLHFEVKE